MRVPSVSATVTGRTSESRTSGVVSSASLLLMMAATAIASPGLAATRIISASGVPGGAS